MAGTATSFPTAHRVDGFTYAIRNIVAEARKVEAAGTPVTYLNIGDPIPFGFSTPPALIEAVPVALGRRPDAGGDLAGVLEFLACPAGRNVTGATLCLDGGEWLTP